MDESQWKIHCPRAAGTGSGLETGPLSLAFPPSQGCFISKQKIINNSRLFLNRMLELAVCLQGMIRGRQGEPIPGGFPPKIPVEGQSWGAQVTWMDPGAPKIQHLCKAVVGAAQASAPHPALTGVPVAGALLRLLPAAKKAPAPVRSSPRGSSVGEPGAAWGPGAQPGEGAVAPGEVWRFQRVQSKLLCMSTL